MSRVASFDGLEIAYDLEGDGPPVLLLHGFASDAYINWIRSGVSQALVGAGFRAIMPDHRGHGGSGKSHDPDAYGDDAMMRDAFAVLDDVGVDRCHVVGYSMGAFVALRIAVDGTRLRSAVLGGVGGNTLRMPEDRSHIVDALEAEDKSQIADPIGRSFRDFADLTRADRKALAAIQRAPRQRFDGLDRIAVPVLVVAGDNDPLAGPPDELADKIPGAKAAVVGGAHLNVPNNPQFHAAVVGFVREVEG